MPHIKYFRIHTFSISRVLANKKCYKADSKIQTFYHILSSNCNLFNNTRIITFVFYYEYRTPIILKSSGPVVQLDRTSDSGSEGWGFESLRDHLTFWSVSTSLLLSTRDPKCFVPC